MGSSVDQCIAAQSLSSLAHGERLQVGERTENSFCVFQDQFDNLEKHTSWGIDFLERYTKFIKERADIELSYAKQIRFPQLSPSMSLLAVLTLTTDPDANPDP